MFRKTLIFFILCLFQIAWVSALDTQLLDMRLQQNLEEIAGRLESKNSYRKIYIYTNLKNYTEQYLSRNTLDEDTKYLLAESIPQIQNRINILEQTLTYSALFQSKNVFSLVLRELSIDQIIQDNTQAIQNTQSVFLFRDTQNISRSRMKKAISKIREINENILIFIDQEGWQINRYTDFDIEYTRADLLDDSFIQVRKDKLTEQEYQLFLSLFPTWWVYFPSLFQVWSLYDSFSEDSAIVMLEMFAYIRLQSHADIWINTYGLVTDLSRGNPSITPLGRSFSKHSSKYELLLDAFALASRETGVLVYLKHFPWVWLWAVDSHNWVLDLRNNTQELKENIELFSYARQTFWDFPLWVMLWHTILPNPLKQRFTEIAKSFDFMITDDLWMQGYSQATWKTFQNGFFSIDELKNSENLMILDRKSSFYIK